MRFWTSSKKAAALAAASGFVLRKILQSAFKMSYHMAFALSQGHHFEGEPVLADLRRLLVGQLAELRVAQRGSKKRDSVGENSVLN